ncbi:MAG: hypothetical protein M3Q71_01655 [Chloroflexota bacterium]|nr:hypothetical protein [Chloroflexota bacterium]
MIDGASRRTSRLLKKGPGSRRLRGPYQGKFLIVWGRFGSLLWAYRIARAAGRFLAPAQPEPAPHEHPAQAEQRDDRRPDALRHRPDGVHQRPQRQQEEAEEAQGQQRGRPALGGARSAGLNPRQERGGSKRERPQDPRAREHRIETRDHTHPAENG